MLYAGKNVVSTSDKLQKVSEEYIFNSIKNPKPEIVSRIRQLRIVRDIDSKRYAMLKKELPYIICGCFNPPFRRTENFAYTESFIVDIDHIESKGLSLEHLRQQLQKDERVEMLFLSPGEDGLKVLFQLKERCYDAGLYSLFYKMFVKQFSQQYQLEQVIDTQTSDVTRACFISIDTNAYFNPNAEKIDIQSFLNLNDPLALFDLKHSMDKEVKKIEAEQRKEQAAMKDSDPDKDEILKIKEILKLRIHPKERAPVVVPQQLDEIISDLKKYIEETGVQVTEILNISYAKKIRTKLGLRLGEVNLFYGKKGFSVVKSPRAGTNAELNDICADLIKAFLDQY